MTSQAQQHPKVSRNERRFFIILIMVGVVLVGFFGLRTVRSYVRLQKMGLTFGTTDVEAIRGWMTIPYIATAYGVPEAYIFKEIGIPIEGNRKRSVSALNFHHAFGQRGVIVEAVKTAIRKYQEASPPSESTP